MYRQPTTLTAPVPPSPHAMPMKSSKAGAWQAQQLFEMTGPPQALTQRYGRAHSAVAQLKASLPPSTLLPPVPPDAVPAAPLVPPRPPAPPPAAPAAPPPLPPRPALPLPPAPPLPPGALPAVPAAPPRPPEPPHAMPMKSSNAGASHAQQLLEMIGPPHWVLQV